MSIIDVRGRSEQFTAVAGKVIPERIVPASVSVNLSAAAAILAAVLLLRSR